MAQNRHISPVRVYAVWPFMRDYAKPTTPFAEEQLAKCRTYEAPSKAHIKRLKRQRLEICPRRPVERPRDAKRLDYNYVKSFAKQTEQALREARIRERAING